MSPQLNNLIDKALARRESLVSYLIAATMHGRDSEALTIEGIIGELDTLLTALTRAGTIH